MEQKAFNKESETVYRSYKVDLHKLLGLRKREKVEDMTDHDDNVYTFMTVEEK